MADIAAVHQAIEIVTGKPSSTKVITWQTITSTNSRGSAIKVADFAEIVVFIYGTIGAATIFLEGAPQIIPVDADYITLLDSQQSAISFSAIPLNPRIVLTVPTFIRPNTSSADGSTDIDVVLILRLRRNN